MEPLDFLDEFERMLERHEPCQWEQVGPCVYCADHKVRLYNGSLPTNRRPPCDSHDWDQDEGLGFYFICKKCGTKEWPDD